MTRREFFRRLFIVRSCVGCEDAFSYKDVERTFCDKCEIKFNAALNIGCRTCFKPARECECMPKTLKDVGALVHRKLYFYEKEEHSSPAMKLIFSMKDKGYRRVSEFCADCLLPLILDELDTLDVDREKLVITNAPRSEKSRRLRGFDHMERVARSLSEKVDIKYERIFRMSFFAREQKLLDAKKRAKNAEKGIRVLKDVNVEGKYVLLIDDMVTTGSSMATCIRKLLRLGARGVLCFSLATKNKM